MPGKRISELTALSGANSANNDDVIIFDATASETKRISRSQLAEGMQADVQVFSNKTTNLTSNTLTGTTAQFNTALSDNNFATQAGSETLTNKTVDSATNTLTVNYKEAQVETSDGSRTHLFTTVAAMLADTGTYTTYTAGQIVEAGGFRYQVAASGASDHHVTNAGGLKLYVMAASDGAYHTRAWGNPSGTDDTTNLRSALALSANGKLVIDYHVSGYDTSVLVPAANTVIEIMAGTTIRALAAATRVLQLQAANITVWGYGATLSMSGTQNSHTLYILYPAENVTVHGLYCYGSGNSGDDVIYVGGSPSLGQVAKNISLYDVRAMGNASTRNGLSLVAVDGFYAESCKFSNGGGSAGPGAGVDIEANDWMSDGTSAAKNWLFKNCEFHDSATWGFIGVFGSDGVCEDCQSYGNGSSGFALSAGGLQFDDTVYRTGDRLAVSAVSTADGWITVSSGTAGVDLLTTDLGIVPGMVIQRQQLAGKTWPTEIAAFVRWVIGEIDVTQTKVRLAVQWLYDKKVALSGGSYAGLTSDPVTSALSLNVYGRAGNLTDISFIRCRSYDNAQNGVAAAEINIGLCGNTILEDCWVRSTSMAGNLAVQFSNTYNTKIIRGDFAPRVYGTSARGISGSTVGPFDIIGTHVEGYGNDGLSLFGFTGGVLRDVTVLNCGMTTAGAFAVDITASDGGVIDNLNVNNSDAFRVAGGQSVVIAATCSNMSLNNVTVTCNALDTGLADNGVGTRRRNVRSKGLLLSEVGTASTANLTSAAHAINTAGKFEGKLVRDTTPAPDRVFMATGTAATSIWLALDGTASITPV